VSVLGSLEGQQRLKENVVLGKMAQLSLEGGKSKNKLWKIKMKIKKGKIK
jgi:hypothetical protein